MMKFCAYFFISAAFLFFSLNTTGQVVNDDIAKRIDLSIGQRVVSNTNECTVEWDCVDETLTGQCIKYHNDQWFQFNSDKFSQLYINIFSQQCRDLRGVQLVLIKGEACRPETYEVLTCQSMGTNNDFYTETIVEPYSDYLINIDGYLEDYCQFTMSVDSIPRGLPAEKNLELENFASIDQNNWVSFQWQLDQHVSSPQRFLIYKRAHSQKRFTLVDSIPIEIDAYGNNKSQYEYADSIAAHENVTYYLTLKDENDKEYWFAEHSFQGKAAVRKKAQVEAEVNCPLKSRVVIIIKDQWNIDVLQKIEFVQTQANEKRQIPVQNYIDQGYQNIKVLVLCDGQPVNSYQVDLNN